MRIVKDQKGLTIFQDKTVFFSGIILFVVFTASSSWIVYLTTLPTDSSLLSVWICRCIFTFSGLSLPVLFLINPERYFVYYCFSQSGIIKHVAFRRKKLIEYSKFPYLMYGGYYHGIVWRDYIILSNRRLNYNELNHVNNVSSDSTMIKIRLSEKVCRVLPSVLPPRYKGKIDALISTSRNKKCCKSTL